MGTSKQEISEWFDRGVAQGATHMMVVCDTFDWEDYPVYVKPDENVRDKYNSHNGPNMQQVMEVYSLKQDKDKQMSEHRAFNFD